VQSGRVAVVTGANAGIGFEVARVLAAHGAAVVIACRDSSRGEAVAARIPGARVVTLDLASLASVQAAAAELREACARLDLLINNAGVMEVPHHVTEDGFELTLATNHLGHFALTGLVLDRLLATPGSRVVTVSSIAHRRGVLESPEPYDPSAAYARSKLANLLFTYELSRRLGAAGAATVALAAHPGIVRTGLWRTSSLVERALISRRVRFVNFWLAQDVEAGALPVLRAATDPAAGGGDYYGPSGPFGFTGRPARAESSALSHDRDAQRRLWELSEQLTGVVYSI